MPRAVRMKRLGLVAVLALLAFPSTATAGGTVSGATHAVVHAIAEELGSATYWHLQAHCRPTAPSRFGCSFSSTVATGPYAGDPGPSGRVTVTYSHRHYYVGEPRFNKPRELGSPKMPCYRQSGC